MKDKHIAVTVDIIIECLTSDGPRGIVLIDRKYPPYGWALPGGYVEYGEPAYEAAIREAKEETSLDVELAYQLYTYSHPGRDPRKHVLTVVYVATAKGTPVAADDAKGIKLVPHKKLQPVYHELVCDHADILKDYENDMAAPMNPDIEKDRY